MDDRHREILHHCLSELEKDLEPKKVLSELTTVLDATDVREVYESGTRVNQVNKLLDFLPRRGPNAFNVFVKALKEKQPHLAITLQNAEMEMMKKELKEERASSARTRNEVDQTKAALEEKEREHKETLKKLEELMSEKKTLMAKSNDYEKEIEKIREELVVEKAICEELRSKVLNAKTALEEEQQKNQEIRKETVKELERKEEKLEESKEKIEKLSGKNKSSTKRIKDLKDQLKNLQNESDENMEKAKKQEKSKLDAKERELDELKDELKRQKSENGIVSEELKINERLRKDLDEENKKLRKTEEEVRAEAEAKVNELAKLKEGFGRVFTYRRDFDEGGVIYAMGTNFGALRLWVNPSSKCAVRAIKVTISRSSDGRGSASDLLEHSDKRGRISCTKEEKEAWWCLELSEKYSLYLTHYTLRHGRYDGDAFLRNWRLEGSLDGQDWRLLKKHDNDSGLCEPSPYTATWPIEGEVRASRFFKIVQTGKNSSNSTKYGIYLSGIELYGVLIEGPIQQ